MHRGVRERDRASRVGDGGRLAAGAENRVEDAQTFLSRFSFGNVLDGTYRTQRAPGLASAFELSLGACEHPAQAAGSIDDAVLDIEQAFTGWIMRGLDRCDHAANIVGVNVADDFRQGGGFLEVPAVHSA